MLPFSAWEIERSFFDVKIFRHATDSPADSGDGAGEKGVDRLHYTSILIEMTVDCRMKPSKLPAKKPMLYFSNPCRNR
jgi:hypothetical protein